MFFNDSTLVLPPVAVTDFVAALSMLVGGCKYKERLVRISGVAIAVSDYFNNLSQQKNTTYEYDALVFSSV